MRFKNLLLGTFLANPLCLVVTTVQSCDKDDVKLPEIDLNDYKDQIKDMLVVGVSLIDINNEISEFFMDKYKDYDLWYITPTIEVLGETSSPMFVMPGVYRISLWVVNNADGVESTNTTDVEVDLLSFSNIDIVDFTKYISFQPSDDLKEFNANVQDLIVRYFIPLGSDPIDDSLYYWVREHFDFQNLFQNFSYTDMNTGEGGDFIGDGDKIEFSAGTNNPLFKDSFTFEYKKEYINIKEKLDNNFNSLIDGKNEFQDWMAALSKMFPGYVVKNIDSWVNSGLIKVFDESDKDKNLNINDPLVLEDGDTLTIKIKDQSYMADVDGEWTYHSNN
jgi:hypothetical protein